MSKDFKNIAEFLNVISKITNDGSVVISFTGEDIDIPIEKQFAYVQEAKSLSLEEAIINLPTALRYALIMDGYEYLLDNLNWDELDNPTQHWPGHMTSRLLIKFPEMADKADWSKLNNSWISNLLIAHPEFDNRVDFKKITKADAWVNLLRKKPEYSIKCDFSILNNDAMCDYYWGVLLIQQPQFAESCDWSKLLEETKNKIIAKQPLLAKYA